ncbi:MAG: DUF1343 domain-containing protein [Flavobacteriales bacterium]|jgi:uncharacterized protein YbbC (DUF1343 family)|nr:DUF1343 domain-containing protein [Flavobacteriales bacterium]
MKNIFTLFSLFVLSLLEISAQINTGANQTSKYLPLLQGKKVAVVANQTSVIQNTHLVDSLVSLGITIEKVFAPEHGFRGTADAGEKVADGKDKKTGISILSLYGRKNRKPSAEKLANIDLVIFDIQDVGARFYTYISTMHYVMEACAENNIPLLLLDRPNPNGFYVDGPVLEMSQKSFIGMHPVPIVHGMTIAEYAQMINGEKWLNNGIQCQLEIIQCSNYTHKDKYHLPIAPSPNLPNMTSIYLYPSLCLFEGTNVSVGRGTTTPFQIFGSPFIPSTDFSFIPQPMFGAKHPKHENKRCHGYDLTAFGDHFMPELGELYLHWLTSMYHQSSNPSDFFRKDGFFYLLTGNKKIKQMIEEGKSVKTIRASWKDELNAFKMVRKKYLLYPDFE